MRAFLLVAPLLTFLFVVLGVPIATLLSLAVADTIVAPALSHTIAALGDWQADAEIPEDAYSALVEDLAAGSPESIAKAAGRLNIDMSGFRSLLLKTKDQVSAASGSSARDMLIAIDQRWADRSTWLAIKRASGPVTDMYLLGALDLRRDDTGAIVQQPESQRVFVDTIIRTFTIATGVTLLTLLIGFPFAYTMTSASRTWTALLLFVVLLPFWTSVLVRTLSWSVLLQRDGVINQALESVGLIDAPLELMFNRTAVYVALVYVFLPFMILPLYSVMRGIPPAYGRAAASLGAPPFTVFRRIYLPQVMPGVGAGSLLVFIQCLGVYVTPSLLGGPKDQGISTMIAFYVNRTLNWGMAAALSLILIVATIILYRVYVRLIGADALRMA